MNRREFTFALPLALSPLWLTGTRQDRWPRGLDDFVRKGMAETRTPGLAVAVIDEAQRPQIRTFGFANVASKSSVTADSIFHIASVSKVVTATAMMMLLEAGAFELDAPIAPHLDFPVVHPRFPKVPITFRQLFSHTSGISDAQYQKTSAFVNAKGAMPELREFLAGYLSPGGQWYSPETSFSENPPGRVWDYSNVAVALLGHLAGRLSGKPLDTFTRERIFAPLGMSATAWSPVELPPGRIVTPYANEPELRELPPTLYPDWPAGSLRSSITDFASFMRIFCERGAVAGRYFLKPSTLDTFFTAQSVTVSKDDPTIHQALIWLLRDVKGMKLASHSGGDPGTDALACLDLRRRKAVLCFANVTGSKPYRAFQKELVIRLLT